MLEIQSKIALVAIFVQIGCGVWAKKQTYKHSCIEYDLRPT